MTSVIELKINDLTKIWNGEFAGINQLFFTKKGSELGP